MINNTKDVKDAKNTPQYLIKINYKSGISHQFWVYEFSMNNQSCSWVAVDQLNKPLIIGFDNIESVYQIGIKN